MGSAIAADGKPSRAFVRRERRECAAECVGIRFAKRLSDDSADVIFAKDGSIEAMGHARTNSLKQGFIQAYSA